MENMMKMQCPKCGASGQMDDAKIPEGGAKVRCPRCSERFFVNKDQSGQEATPLFESNEQPAMPPPLRMEDPTPPQTTSFSPPTFHETCSLCKNNFSRMDLIRFGDNWLCAKCKPAYLQMLQQGLDTPEQKRYAGFWIRLGAKFLDGLIVGALNLIVSLPFAFAGDSADLSTNLAKGVVQLAVQIAIAVAYTVFFLGKFQATPGKMACGLLVVTADGGNVTYMRAMGRHFAEFLSSIILMIGYIMAAFDQEKRALHDRICDTRVVHK
jgi:predicted Zn finger-like uncharacterized protein